MNAASVQIRVILDNQKKVLLSGDATPNYIENIDDYDIIQFPHHGQLEDGKAILNELDDPYSKEFLISDNTGSGQTSGGSADLVEYMKMEKFKTAYNTQNGVISLPTSDSTSNVRGVRLGVFYT